MTKIWFNPVNVEFIEPNKDNPNECKAHLVSGKTIIVDMTYEEFVQYFKDYVRR